MSARRPRLHIVVTCTNRKRRPVPTRLLLRGVSGVRTETRIGQWTERLTSSDVDRVRAEDLYAGEHWDVARKLPASASGFARTTLWVASAGWGLVPAAASIRPYSATFATGHADSVPPGREGTRAWWNAVAAWSGSSITGPRSLTELVAEHPRDRVLLVLSQTYFTACTDDLTAAQTSARESQLSIVAAGVAPSPGFASSQLLANARLQHQLGGTRGALNARIAAALLSRGLTEHDEMQHHLAQMLKRSPSLPVYGRRVVTDSELSAFIRDRRAYDMSVSRTGLLRQLRDAGMACEQSRFARIYATTADVLS